jgi:hypothetical protein
MRLAAARGDGLGHPVFVEETGVEQPIGRSNGTAVAVDEYGAERPVVDVYGDFRTKFGAFVKIRNVLVRQRIRAHVVSGIEFQMAVFIIGPLTGWIIGTTVVAGALLVAFELLLIYKLWTATRSYVRHLAAAGVSSEAEAETKVQAAGFGPGDLRGQPAAAILPVAAVSPRVERGRHPAALRQRSTPWRFCRAELLELRGASRRRSWSRAAITNFGR